MNISFDGYLAQKDRITVIQSMKILRDKLPFLMQISKDERRKIANIGRAREPFVRRVQTMANQNEDFLPRFTSLNKFNQDMEMFQFFIEILTFLRPMHEAVEDTSMILSAGMYKSSRAYLHIARMAVLDGVPGTDSMVEDLERFFDNFGGPKNPDSDSDSPSDSPSDDDDDPQKPV